ncbi:hypothetical protein GYRE_00742 [Yokenella regensburgei ATCC 49455]|uniref:Lipoprotein activator of PBP from the outer membrane A n=1 Tax=Yokenella regensburgei TaxID=158877 RepID=A0AB38FVN4_9ENTR|nr:hypothetical protein GYRE_00742 [Yokenella regensburgei ATCC 49455]SQA63014.1 Lipoprotein activator of PBP from the outer membrane A [Yokenella regensburgei]SQB02257.1 Lipoprotein activator of PBP from the outer membrane A [Yokenella regensburgei]SUQ07442.1 Lipoprotein activator of PBP from the outer membrane A [Yokenella regensburgei]
MQLSGCFCKNVTHGFLLISAALFFTGCAVRPVDRGTDLLESPVQNDSAQALRRMQQSTGSSKTSRQLLAIRALLREGKNQQAADLFSQLLPKMDDAQKQEQSLLAVELKLAQGDFTGAQRLLTKISPDGLKGALLVRYRQSMVTALQGNPFQALLRALNAQAPLLITTREKHLSGIRRTTGQGYKTSSKSGAIAAMSNSRVNTFPLPGVLPAGCIAQSAVDNRCPGIQSMYFSVRGWRRKLSTARVTSPLSCMPPFTLYSACGVKPAQLRPQRRAIQGMVYAPVDDTGTISRRVMLTSYPSSHSVRLSASRCIRSRNVAIS